MLKEFFIMKFVFNQLDKKEKKVYYKNYEGFVVFNKFN